MFRTRRAHRKSRMGCFACKRRKVKCDELKPSCTRCELSLQKCAYPPAVFSAANEPMDKLSLPSPPCSVLSLSPCTSSFSEASPSFKTSTRSTPAVVEATRCSDAADAALPPSDADLYHHYLEHTSRTLTHCQRDYGSLQIGIPTLALKSETVFHSLLALSAVCLCCDMISKEPPPKLDAVNQVLMTGYRLYNLASEQMRELISQPDALRTEPLLVSALMLVPFTAASQQINHWISRKSGRQESHKLLSATPRDVIVMMRGIRATLQSLDCRDLGTPQETESTTDRSSPLLGFNISAAPPSSRKHVMFPILAATSQGAFSKLRERLESLCHSNACYEGGRCTDAQLSACAAAFELLVNIRTNAFSPSNSSAPRSIEPTAKKSLKSESVSLPHAGPWLRAIAGRHMIPEPTEPLTRPFLGFLSQAPQAYLDLVLPLLDERLERSIGTPSADISTQLTKEQALALDIYAHWSVLMFLVEEESWWIGTLPVVTLTGMMNRYGDHFVTRLWPDGAHGQGQWWPGSMLTILREIKGCR
ncbi:hypothetical protein NA57DRAFT_44210 [Rhizodiscina lignyota]|uniref:Zn(2)-C6 fungal-type domain-containing protein n=1 Tax=Rhizodiscina lignyota TaxID=1504668 RepID=A0A9P4M7C8_9PEZI|nr:hypothetical protein NA57DRAFT_44210 [Rhizodiscina lignyota]